MKAAALRGALEGLRGLLTNAWTPYLAFISLANFVSPELSYIQLALYSAYSLSRAERERPALAHHLTPFFALAQLPVALASPRSQPSPLSLLSSALTGVVEELYFRGIMQLDLGVLPQAFAFALAHVRLRDPVSLVESTLLFPHYLILGVAFGIVAERGGYLSSALAHALYNAVSTLYTPIFSLDAVALLLASDGLLVSTLVLATRLGDSLNKVRRSGLCMERRHLERATLAISAALAASPVLAYALRVWDPYWIAITNLGDEPAYVVLSILLYTLVSPELGFYALLSLMTSGWVNVLLKNAFALPRPPRELWKIEVSGYGFPSGHAQTSTAFWSSIALKLRNFHAAVLGAVIIALVAYSRLELMVHYPRDVVGGIALGLACALAALWLIRVAQRWERRRQSLFLAAYGALVSLLYLLHPDVMYARIGGVTIGLSAYPMVSLKLQAKRPLPARVFSAVIALIVALSLTRASAAAAPPVQLVAYALVALTAVLSPLAKVPLGRAAGGSAKAE